MYIEQEEEEGCCLSLSFAKWMKWPMGNWKQMVNDEQIMKRREKREMMIASWVCTRKLFLTQLEAVSVRVVISRILLIVHFRFYFVFNRHNEPVRFVCQSSSFLYPSNTQVIRSKQYLNIPTCLCASNRNKRKKNRHQPWRSLMYIYRGCGRGC